MRAWLGHRVEGLPVAAIAALGIALAVYPLVATLPFWRHVVIMSMLYGAMGVAWNILGGLAGQVSFGHALYFGVGAYAAAYCYKVLGLAPLVSIPIALAVSCVAAVLVGLPTFRLRGHYFVLASVFIMEGIHIVVSNWDRFGAAIGLEYPVYKAKGFADALWHGQFQDKLPYYYLAFLLLGLALVVFRAIQRSPFGMFLVAIREEQDAAQSLGVNVARCKLYALVASAAITTLCGTFYAQYVLYVEPSSTMSLVISLEICFIAILGGIGTLWGPVLGAFVIVPVTELLRAYLSGRIALDMSALADGGIAAWLEYYARGGGGNLDILAYGLMIMLIARFQPAGVLGFLRRID
ncbi:MAG: branched-chain amino acid ABC transporter permease [Alphaproteobacteria bacterium]|nr:branched-chain amino acid ABC transporter permease [Alphaproteobacteria bacterium]